MVEFILLYLLSWPALATILCFGVLAEHYDCPKLAVFLGIVAIIIAYILFKVPLNTLILIACVYLIIGVLWSFWRYTRFVSKGVALIKLEFQREDNKAYAIQRLAPNENLGKIVRWILIWPLSLVGSITGDIITLVQKLVTKVFNEVYAKIFSSYTKDL